MNNLQKDYILNEPTDDKKIPTKEFLEALEELDYMETHTEEYKVYYSVEELFEDLDKN